MPEIAIAQTYSARLLGDDAAQFGPFDYQLLRDEVRALAAMYFPADQVINAVNVAREESGYHTGAWNRDGEDSRGLWQINVVLAAHPELRNVNLFDARVNAYFAAEIYKAAGDWSPWLNSATKLNLPGGRQ